jgi:hypothetical protein
MTQGSWLLAHCLNVVSLHNKNMVAWKNIDNNEIIQTVKPGGKKGISISVSIYEKLRKFILEKTESIVDEITLVELIEMAEKEIKGVNSVSFILMHVKLDLECRGYLRSVTSQNNPGQMQKCVRITSKGMQLIHQLANVSQ